MSGVIVALILVVGVLAVALMWCVIQIGHLRGQVTEVEKATSLLAGLRAVDLHGLALLSRAVVVLLRAAARAQGEELPDLSAYPGYYKREAKTQFEWALSITPDPAYREGVRRVAENMERSLTAVDGSTVMAFSEALRDFHPASDAMPFVDRGGNRDH